MEDLSNIVRVRRLTLAGHILRLPPGRLASVAMQEGSRRGPLRKTWRQTFQEDLQEMQVSWSGVRRVASDRSRWKTLVAQCSNRSGTVGGSKSKSLGLKHLGHSHSAAYFR